MKIRYLLGAIISSLVLYSVATCISGCAQIGYPTGGDKDTIPPVLLRAEPTEFKTNFTGNKITLIFDEYIDIKDVQNNLLVSPYPKNLPTVTHKLKTVTIKVKDTLEPNTTYAINFGNALQDLNEGNPFRNYTYVFSTGNYIDSLTLSGNVIMAETGKADSTLIAMLYKNAVDSTVQHRKPDYIARVDRDGNYIFKNLAAGSYKLYALKDGDGGKTYNSVIEPFAFASNDVELSNGNAIADTLFAYEEEKDDKKTNTTSSTAPGKGQDKKFKASTKVNPNTLQGLIEPLEISFNRTVQSLDAQQIYLTDTAFNKIPNVSLTLDSTRKIAAINTQWAEGFTYLLFINKQAAKDTTGAELARADTIRFSTKEKKNYGNLVLRFATYDSANHIVLHFLQQEKIVKSVALRGKTWSDKLFEPGEYELRIVYDTNNNGQWDPGNYSTRRQPEKAITLTKKISVRADWDNEKDIEL